MDVKHLVILQQCNKGTLDDAPEYNSCFVTDK